MNKKLFDLALQRAQELGQDVFNAHQELMKWRDPVLTDTQKTTYSLKLQNSIEEQWKWLNALREELEKEVDS